ncbi:MAG: amino acid permease [Planctomycetota bacterium]|jgi:amino acid transporter/nucleotide-binding universal stress UspA family protein
MASNPESSSSPAPELSRELSLFHVTMMGLGMMIGAGVFLGMGISISEAGPGGVILTFALNGLLAMLTAMSFAELSSAIPRAGGAYNFARIGFGRGTSFLAGWMEWFASSVAGSMYALTFAIYTVRFAAQMGWLDFAFRIAGVAAGTEAAEPLIGNIEKVVAVTTAFIFIYINFRGSSETGKIGAFITMGQTLFVVTIGIVGIITAMKDPSRLENFTPFMPKGWSQLLVTMGFTYVAFEGYEVIAQAGDEAIDPRRNLPKAMIYSVCIVTSIYILVAFATVVSVKSGAQGVEGPVWEWIGSFGKKGFGEAVAKLMPYKNIGNFVLTLAVIFSSTSALNATVYSATRASYALGRDSMLPKFFAKIHKVTNTPYGALIATSVIVLIVTTMLPTEDVASSASIMFLFLFFMVNLCVIKIRRSMADELEYGFLMPLFPLFPILAIICQIVLAIWLVHMSLIAWIVAPIWIVAGLGIYWFYARSRATTTEDEILVIEEQKHHEEPVDGKYPIMVAVANPANASQLIQSTYRLCGAKDARLELIHMVQVPDQVSLHDAEKYTHTGKEGLMEVMLSMALHFPISTTIRYCRNVARGIVSAIREKKTKMLVLGWHGVRHHTIFNLGSKIDPIIEQAPCNVVVLKDCGGNKEFKKVLVPVAGGPNGALALEIAGIMARHDEGTVTAFSVDTGRGGVDFDQFLAEGAKKFDIDRDRLDTKSIKAKSAVKAILKEAKDYDLVVLGTTERPLLAQMGRMSLPEKIASRTPKPVVMVKSDIGVRSWIRRWI